jgi:hypothetical protein
MTTKVLENISGRLRTFILSGAHLEAHPTHEHCYKPVKTVTVHQSKSGQLVARALTRTMPDALRLSAGEVREVDEALIHCPDIKGAIARGELRVSDPKPKASETPPPTPQPEPEEPKLAEPAEPPKPARSFRPTQNP